MLFCWQDINFWKVQKVEMRRSMDERVWWSKKVQKSKTCILSTELKNMEWNKLVSPLQADGKHCVHDVLFLTFIWLVKGVSVHVQLTHVKSF